MKSTIQSLQIIFGFLVAGVLWLITLPIELITPDIRPYKEKAENRRKEVLRSLQFPPPTTDECEFMFFQFYIPDFLAPYITEKEWLEMLYEAGFAPATQYPFYEAKDRELFLNMSVRDIKWQNQFKEQDAYKALVSEGLECQFDDEEV